MENNYSKESYAVKPVVVQTFKKKWMTPGIEIISQDIIASGGPTFSHEGAAQDQFKAFYHS